MEAEDYLGGSGLFRRLKNGAQGESGWWKRGLLTNVLGNASMWLAAELANTPLPPQRSTAALFRGAVMG
jgi:hypothetical protein